MTSLVVTSVRLDNYFQISTYQAVFDTDLPKSLASVDRLNSENSHYLCHRSSMYCPHEGNQLYREVTLPCIFGTAAVELPVKWNRCKMLAAVFPPTAHKYAKHLPACLPALALPADYRLCVNWQAYKYTSNGAGQGIRLRVKFRTNGTTKSKLYYQTGRLTMRDKCTSGRLDFCEHRRRGLAVSLVIRILTVGALPKVNELLFNTDWVTPGQLVKCRNTFVFAIKTLTRILNWKKSLNSNAYKTVDRQFALPEEGN